MIVRRTMSPAIVLRIASVLWALTAVSGDGAITTSASQAVVTTASQGVDYKVAQATASPLPSPSDATGDLEAAAGGEHKSYQWGHGDEHKKDSHHSDHGKKWGHKDSGKKDHHDNWGKKHWGNHGHDSHGKHNSHQSGGKHGNHWDDWGAKEKVMKDKGHGYVKAFSWDREQGEKNKWGSKGGKYDQHHNSGHGAEHGKSGHGDHGSSAWGDMGDYGNWGASDYGSLWGGMGDYGMSGGHWANGAEM